MATPDLDPQAVLAAVYKAGSICRAYKLFPDMKRKPFQKFCREHGITAVRAKEELASTDNVTVNVAAPPHVQPVIRYRVAQNGGASSEATRSLWMGDPHDGPTIPDKSRFYCAGRYAAEHRLPLIGCIGDMLTLDSLCRYERNETLRGKAKPSFKQDMASGKAALAALNEGLGDWKPEKHVTLGNHEDRIFSFTNNHPEMEHMLEENVHTILQDAGWTYSPFGAIHYVGGVAFTHAPLTTMGKPYGGRHCENQIGNDSVTDVVFGHSHRRVEKSLWKLGGQKITVLNLGCSLPPGHVEPYAKHSLGDGNWDYGVYDITIQSGHIRKAHWIPLEELLISYR
jgi:hypothetical protein